MRNLKKFLALVLAMMMVFSLMITVNASTGAPDDAKISDDYREAMEVLSAIGVFKGDEETGELRPGDPISRAEFAVILYRAATGDTAGTKPALTAMEGTDSVFSDVANYEGGWAVKWVNYAVSMGWLKGDTEGTFRPGDNVTYYEVMVSLLRVLGLDKGIGGDNWEFQTAMAASDAGIVDNIDSFIGYAAREEVGQMALNTLTYGEKVTKSVPKYVVVAITKGFVDAEGSVAGESYDTFEEALVKAQAVEVSGSPAAYNTDFVITTISVEETTTKDSLAEDKFGLMVSERSAGTDAMGRPGIEYTYGTWSAVFANDANSTTVVKGSAQTVPALVTAAKKGATATAIYVNGKLDNSAATQVGDIVEVYVKGTSATVCITRYTVAQLTGDATTRTQSGTAQVRVPGVTAGYVSADEVEGWQGLSEDDIVYYYKDNDDVYHIGQADYIIGTITQVNTSGSVYDYTIGGKEYKKNAVYPASAVVSANGADPLASTFNFKDAHIFYLDDNGLIIWSEPVTDGATNNYAIIEEIGYVSGDGQLETSKYVQARLLLMDGTTQIVTVSKVTLADGKVYEGTGEDGTPSSAVYLIDTTNSPHVNDAIAKNNAKVGNAFFTYVMKSGKCELTEVDDGAGSTNTKTLASDGSNAIVIKNGAVQITMDSTKVTVDNKTVFIVSNKDADKPHTYTAYVGYNAVPNISSEGTANTEKIYYLLDNDVATYVFVPDWYENNAGANGEKVFVLSASPLNVIAEDELTYGVFPVLVNGETYAEVKIEQTDTSNKYYGGLSTANTVAMGVYTPTYEDGVITKLTAVAVTDSATGGKGYNAANNTLVLDPNSAKTPYSYTDDVKVFTIEKSSSGKVTGVTPSTGKQLRDDPNNDIYVVHGTGDKAAVVEYVIVNDVDDSNTAIATMSIVVASDKTYALTDDPATITKSGNTYTVALAAAGKDKAATFTVTAPYAAKVEYKGSATAIAAADLANQTFAVADSTVNKVQTADQGTSDAYAYMYLKVTAHDDTVTYYTVVLVTPHS